MHAGGQLRPQHGWLYRETAICNRRCLRTWQPLHSRLSSSKLAHGGSDTLQAALPQTCLHAKQHLSGLQPSGRSTNHRLPRHTRLQPHEEATLPCAAQARQAAGGGAPG